MDLILLFPIMQGHILLYSFIIRRGIVDQLTVLTKMRDVSGAIPSLLSFHTETIQGGSLRFNLLALICRIYVVIPRFIVAIDLFIKPGVFFDCFVLCINVCYHTIQLCLLVKNYLKQGFCGRT